jgi:hypothetical protein
MCIYFRDVFLVIVKASLFVTNALRVSSLFSLAILKVAQGLFVRSDSKLSVISMY